MKIPNELLYKVITKIAANHKNKDFDIYTKKDIEQQVWVIALKMIHQFNPKKAKYDDLEKSLEHWLNIVISSRLKNLYRNEYTTKYRDKNKKSINSSCLHSVDTNQLFVLIDSDDSFEILDILLKEMSELDFEIFEALLSNEYIPSYYKNKLVVKLKDILSLHYGENAI